MPGARGKSWEKVGKKVGNAGKPWIRSAPLLLRINRQRFVDDLLRQSSEFEKASPARIDRILRGRPRRFGRRRIGRGPPGWRFIRLRKAAFDREEKIGGFHAEPDESSHERFDLRSQAVVFRIQNSRYRVLLSAAFRGDRRLCGAVRPRFSADRRNRIPPSGEIRTDNAPHFLAHSAEYIYARIPRIAQSQADGHICPDPLLFERPSLTEYRHTDTTTRQRFP
jgi:hypothetical protein